MLFNVMIFVIFAAIAYFHYAQGLFTAALSAALCVLATALAIGYHELLTPYLMKIPEQADAIALLGIFVAAYTIPRLLMDNLIPGNVRFPVLVDKIGAGVMGVIAGLFASGLFALAAQSMPFDSAIGGYSRQDLQDRANITVTGDSTSNGRSIDTSISNELVGDRFGDPNHAEHLWLHQDDLVLAFAQQFSDPGSALADDHPLEAAHPDYLLELFSNRVGAPIGSKRVAVNTDQSQVVHVAGAYAITKPIPPKLAMDSELPSIRGEMTTPDVPAPGENVLAVVRVTFTNDPNFVDTDGFLRFAPCSLRLVAGNKDYFPIGTMVGGNVLLKNRPDDPLLTDLKKGAKTVDFLFAVSADDLDQKTDGKEKKISFKPGSFIDFKRYAQQDLRQMELGPQPTDFDSAAIAQEYQTSGDLGGILRKTGVGAAVVKAITGLTVSAPPEQPSSNKQSGTNTQNKGARNNSQDLLPDLPNHQFGM